MYRLIFKSIYRLMKEEFLQGRFVYGEETRMQVINEPDQKGSTPNWMRVYLTDEFSCSPRIILFQYEKTRVGYHTAEFLENQFQRYFTCDGYLTDVPQPAGGSHSSNRVHGLCETGLMNFTILKKYFTKEQFKETVAY